MYVCYGACKMATMIDPRLSRASPAHVHWEHTTAAMRPVLTLRPAVLKCSLVMCVPPYLAAQRAWTPCVSSPRRREVDPAAHKHVPSSHMSSVVTMLKAAPKPGLERRKRGEADAGDAMCPRPLRLTEAHAVADSLAQRRGAAVAAPAAHASNPPSLPVCVCQGAHVFAFS